MRLQTRLCSTTRDRGITTIAALAVVALVLIVIAILIPNLPDSLLKAKLKRSVADMRNVGLARESRRQGGVDRSHPRAQIDYHWNAWADPSSVFAEPSCKPVEHLKPDSSYLMTIDLSALAYELEAVAGASKPAGGVTSKLLEELRKSTLDHYTLRLVLLTDQRLFKTRPQVVGDLTIDLAKVRRYADLPKEDRPTRADMPSLCERPTPSFVFGRHSFELETADAEGMGSVALSLWDLTRGRPVEELSIPLCVADSPDGCEPGSGSMVSFRGSTALGLAAEESKELPAAALHLVQLSEEAVFGVFASNQPIAEGPSPYSIWKVTTEDIGTSEFTKRLREHQQNFGRAIENAASASDGLTKLLFPKDQDDSKAARARISAFVAEHAGDARPFTKSDPPRLFVRTVLKGLPRPVLYPLGLMNFEGTAEGFVGFHFQVESPLPRQRYAEEGVCVGRWRPVLPDNSATGALEKAFKKLDDRIDLAEDDPDLWVYSVAGREPVIDSMPSFLSWISEEVYEDVPTVIAVVSHHSQNTLFFEDLTVHADNVARIFVKPSAAILSGCTTGQFGASGLISELNRTGVDAVIATNTGISGNLAGDYMGCLSDALESATTEVAIGTAHWHALRCLYEIKRAGSDPPQSLYGPSVLSFTLAGNPNLRLCTETIE